MGTGSFPGVKRPGRGAEHSLTSSTEVEGRVELYICSPSGSSWSVLLLFLRFLEPNSRFTLKMDSECVVILKLMTVLSVPDNQERRNSTV